MQGLFLACDSNQVPLDCDLPESQNCRAQKGRWGLAKLLPLQEDGQEPPWPERGLISQKQTEMTYVHAEAYRSTQKTRSRRHQTAVLGPFILFYTNSSLDSLLKTI